MSPGDAGGGEDGGGPEDPAPPAPDSKVELLPAGEAGEGAMEAAEALPVVARLVVEIRSDGTQTVARGRLEERRSGESVEVAARASSPLELAAGLARILAASPALAWAKTRADRVAAPSRRPGLLARLLGRDEPR